jgi:hypothetical protein
MKVQWPDRSTIPQSSTARFRLGQSVTLHQTPKQRQELASGPDGQEPPRARPEVRNSPMFGQISG